MAMWYQVVLIFYSCMSVMTFTIYGVDKYRAKQNQWRIRESVLLWISFLGGAVGALLGMQVFRHKTKHRYFGFVGFLGLVWQMALAVYLRAKGL